MKPNTLFKVLVLVASFPFAAGCALGSEEESAPGQQSLGASSDAEGIWRSTKYSFGLCSGECITTVSRDGAELSLKACTHNQGCPRSNLATLTDEGARKLDEIEDALSGVALDDRYGCPDCADGGATSVHLRRDGLETSHLYGYAEAPAPLLALDHLVAELRLGLDSCTPGPLLTLSPGCTPK
ncbi:hypothetical protein [Sorangium atrum]|uniref:Lipoprotein n=1 Tax=Sorangium atrum TaxID=2995308 RepID=A0ABT5C3C2_9BACT|nr:hypothetical protein [Sorangium aterium]MDC0680198.1 hypothetical protein [Sorangium aterium]